VNQDLKILELLIKKKELGITDEEIAAFKQSLEAPKQQMTEEEIKKVFSPVTPYDGLTDEEILYYATSYFDVLQEEKELKKQRIEGEISHGAQGSEIKHDANRRQGAYSKSTTG